MMLSACEPKLDESISCKEATSQESPLSVSSAKVMYASTKVQYEFFPTEVQGLIESYLPPSDCARLSASSLFLHRRWTARRWQRTFHLHYGKRNQWRSEKRAMKLKRARRRMMKQNQSRYRQPQAEERVFSNSRFSAGEATRKSPQLEESRNVNNQIFENYSKCYADGWELTFVGCCHDHDSCSNCKRPNVPSISKSDKAPLPKNIDDANALRSVASGEVDVTSGEDEPYTPGDDVRGRYHEDYFDDMSAFTTQFNVTALVPSVRRAYVDLWDTIELSMLGYYDVAIDPLGMDANHNDQLGTIAGNHNHPHYPVPAIMRVIRTSVLPELAEYLFFVVGFKPLATRGVGAGTTRRRRRDGGVMGPMLTRGLGVRVLPRPTNQNSSQPQRLHRHQQVTARGGTGTGTTDGTNMSSDLGNLTASIRPGVDAPPLSGGLVHRSNTGIEAQKKGTILNSTEDDTCMKSDSQTSHFEATASPITTLEEINSLRNTATTMSAWKLACILRERGVECMRCSICDCIDLIGDDVDEDDCDKVMMDGSPLGDINEDEGNESNFLDDDDDVSQSNGLTVDLHQGLRRGGIEWNETRRQNQSYDSGRTSFLREFQKRNGGGQAWMTPCQCPELVHRQCLERKLKLVPKYGPWELTKLHFGRFSGMIAKFNFMLAGPFSSIKTGSSVHQQLGYQSGFADYGDKFHLRSSLADTDVQSQGPLAPRVWISYDDSSPLRRRRRSLAGGGSVEDDDEDSVISVDHLGRFRSPAAKCETCGERYLRTVRLPRSKSEVIAASLSDPLSMIRAASTFIHFILACAFLAACEGMCSDTSCASHRTLLDTPLGVLKWPTTGLNGFALAWWQLQQCCMLHIFFSRRFAAIVDRLWMGPISLFYCRLYFYFIVTSALLAASYIPLVSRTIRIYFLTPVLSPWILEIFQPLADLIALANLFQYAVVSTTVICIFWRTNYRIFTVADGKEAAANLHIGNGLARNANDNAQTVIGVGHTRRRVLEVGDGRAMEAGQVGVPVPRNAANEFQALMGGDEFRRANNDPVARIGVPIRRIVGVGAGDNNAWHTHPIYHGPW